MDIERKASQAELKFVESTFGKKSAIAGLFGLHRSTIGRWGDLANAPGPENALKIAMLRVVILKLSTLFHPQTIEKWLFGINAFLGDRKPIDLIKENRIAEVMSAIEQEEAGGYA